MAQVGQPLANDYSAAGLVRHAFLFVLIWLAWTGYTAFVTRFDHDDAANRVPLLAQCFIAAVMAANAKEGLDSASAAGFGAAYAGIRVALVMQYLRVRAVAETRELTTRYAAGFGLAAIIWIASAFLNAPARYRAWGLALAIDLSTPWIAAKHGARFPPDAAHYPERFGLFTIILLGEFVASVMRGIESQEGWSLSAAGTAFSGMAFGFLLRWWYFDVARGADERHIRGERQARRFDVWQYAHLPLFLGLAVAGVGFERMISHEHGSWILCAAAGMSSGTLAIIGATRHGAAPRLWAQLGLRVASTVLYSGSGPTSGKRFGSIPPPTLAAKARRIPRASSKRPVESVRPGSAIIVSRPQSLNQCYPAMIVWPPPRLMTNCAAARSSALSKGSTTPAASAGRVCAERKERRKLQPGTGARAVLDDRDILARDHRHRVRQLQPADVKYRRGAGSMPELVEVAEPLRVRHARVSIRAQLDAPAVNPNRLLEFRKQHHPADRRLSRRHEQAMVPARVHTAPGGRREAADPVRPQPFAIHRATARAVSSGSSPATEPPVCCSSFATSPVHPVW